MLPIVMMVVVPRKKMNKKWDLDIEDSTRQHHKQEVTPKELPHFPWKIYVLGCILMISVIVKDNENEMRIIMCWLWKRYVAKFRHSIPHVAKGWTFSGGENRNPCVAHVDSLGRRMHRAMYVLREVIVWFLKMTEFVSYESKPISLNSIGNWLLIINGENPSTPPSRVAYGGHGIVICS